MFRTAFAAASVAVTALVTAIPAADAQPRQVQVGTLNCSISSSIGLVLGSTRNVSCFFKTDYAPDELYSGTLRRIGLDVGVTSGGIIIWTVFTDTSRYVGMLSGQYVGASAEASLALGLGANVLIGGSNQSVALQPLSVQGQVGIDIAAGISELTLHPGQ